MSKKIKFLIIFCISLVFCQNYQNPLIPHTNAPDPGAICISGVYYVATTSNNSEQNKFPIRQSYNLVNWTIVSYIFPQGKYPTWAINDFWAPEIHYIGPHYIVYYAARDKTGILCVGVAYGKNVLGPFQDIGHPLIRNISVGNIDPTYFFDQLTNKKYIIWKEDGNGAIPVEKYTPIWAAQVSDDALSIIGEKVMLLENDPSSWEGLLVEAPWIIFYQNYYYLFYSANIYSTPQYALGVSKSKSVLGPYKKSFLNPFLHSNKHWSGPGHCSILSVNNTETDYFLLYHSWYGSDIPKEDNQRVLLMDSIYWSNGWPFVFSNSPSFSIEPVPKLN